MNQQIKNGLFLLMLSVFILLRATPALALDCATGMLGGRYCVEDGSHSWCHLSAEPKCAVETTCPANSSVNCQDNSCTCATGFTYCTDQCLSNTPPSGSNCRIYNPCTPACTVCSDGYELSGSNCVVATLRLGTNSVSGSNVIQSASGALLYVNTTGMGVGTDNPTTKLHVVGATTLSDDLSMVNNKSIKLNSPSDTVLYIGNYNTGGFVFGSSSNPVASVHVEGDVRANKLCFKDDCKSAWSEIQGETSHWTASGSDIYYNTGNVGIGDDTPTNKLTVNGTISANIFKNSDFTNCSNGLIGNNSGEIVCRDNPFVSTDQYWTGTSTNLVAATARTSLGLGSLATLSSVASANITNGTISNEDISTSANISASKIQYGDYFITTAGTSGQVWTSDGSGAGGWAAATGGSSYTAGDGLNLTGSSFSVNNTVVRTSGDQTINGVKSFSLPVIVSTPTTGYHAATKNYVDTRVDQYWTGTSTNLVAATARTSLGLGSLATLSSVASANITNGTISNEDISTSANISASKIQYGDYFITTAGTSGQVWTSDGSGAGGWAAATGGGYTHPTGFSNQPATALTGVSVISQVIVNSDGHVTGANSRNLGSLATLSAVSSGNITDGTITDVDISSSAGISSSKINFGSGSTGQVWTSNAGGVGSWQTVTGGSSYTAGDGLNLTGSSFSVNNTVVRTSGNQTINGVKSFSSIINGNIAGNAGTATSLKDAPSVCGSGHYARGIDVSGNALNCTPVPEGNSYTAGNGLSLSSNKFSLAANGTANYLTKWTGTNTLGQSIIQESSDGYFVGIGTTPVSNVSLSVGSDIRYGGFINQVGISGGYRVFDGANPVKCPDASVGTNRECIFNPAADHSPVRGSVSTQGSFILDGYASAEWGNTGAFQGRASDSANMPSFSWRGSESEMGMYKAATNKLAFSTNGQEKMTIDSAGTLIVKNNSGNRMLNLTTNGSTGNIRMTIGNAGSASELDVGTIDPVYTIGGKKYATYMAGMVGIKEETNGVLSLSKQSAGLFMTKIDFKNAPESSDIWLFGKVTNLIGNRDHFDETTCLLTPNFAGQIWYEKDWANLSINIFARPDNINRDNVEVSYRLTAPRFDKIDRTNFSDSEGEGFNLDKLLK